jgi:hypothetical protein
VQQSDAARQNRFDILDQESLQDFGLACSFSAGAEESVTSEPIQEIYNWLAGKIAIPTNFAGYHASIYLMLSCSAMCVVSSRVGSNKLL